MTKSKIIPEKAIKKAIRAGACMEAINWLQKKPRTFAGLVRADLDWAWWAVDRLLSPKALTNLNLEITEEFDKAQSSVIYKKKTKVILRKYLERYLG